MYSVPTSSCKENVNLKGFILHNMQKIHEISDGKHVMLLCENEEQHARAAAEWINYGLEEGQHCIYA
jgi:hypothetical protein